MSRYHDWLMDAAKGDPGELGEIALLCPECGEDVWDGPHGSKLAKCWNTEGHESGGTLAFDTMSEDDA